MLEEVLKRGQKAKRRKIIESASSLFLWFCSCDTSGRGAAREGGGSVSVDCGAQTETDSQSAL